MLKMRKDQLREFSSSARHQANIRLMAYARERFPSQFRETAKADLFEFVTTVRSTANQYGIRKENDVATFLDFTVMYGSDFHQSPWARDALSTKALYGPDKMAVLRHRVRETGIDL